MKSINFNLSQYSFFKSIFSFNFRKFSSDNLKFYSSFRVFRDNAALAVRPLPPVFTQNQSSQSTYASVGRVGSMSFEIFPNLSQTRQSSKDVDEEKESYFTTFDWANGKKFHLTPLEISRLLLTTNRNEYKMYFQRIARDNTPAKYLHCIHLGPTQPYTFKMEVEEETPFSLSISITGAEMYVLRTLLHYSIPFLYGWPNAIEPSLQLPPDNNFSTSQTTPNINNNSLPNEEIDWSKM